MDRADGAEYEAFLTILEELLGVARAQTEEAVAARRSAGEWERRAILSTASLANALVMRVREAEIRERRLRSRLTELAARAERPERALRQGLIRILRE